MTYTGSTGARWLDIALMGAGIGLVPAIITIALLVRPGSSLDPLVAAATLLFGVLGVIFLVTGVWYGKKTRWKVPDSDRPERLARQKQLADELLTKATTALGLKGINLPPRGKIR